MSEDEHMKLFPKKGTRTKRSGPKVSDYGV
jgi:hypothetical protein